MATTDKNENKFIFQNIINFAYFVKMELYPYQALWTDMIEKTPASLIVASRRSGKLLKSTEPILTENGWVEMQNLKLSDKVYGSDGKLAKINFITPLQKNVKMYKITLRDGRTVECCEDHLWKVFRKNDNRGTKYPDIKWTVHKTKDMYKDFKLKRINSPHKKKYGEIKYLNEYQYALPLNKPVELPEKKLLLHPYILGCLLGDGCITQKKTTFSSNDIEIVEKIKSLLPKEFDIVKHKNKFKWGIIQKNKPEKYKSFRNVILNKLGIGKHNSFDKFIPEIYKNSSIEQRLELIRGLMDTDGTVSKKVAEYYTVSEQLKDDIMEVLRSLGIYTNFVMKKVYIGKKRYADCYRIKIFTDKDIFFLPRKRKLFNVPKGKQANSRYKKVFITNIEPIENADGYCIGVENKDNTYLIHDYIVTHNSFSVAFTLIYLAYKYPNTKVNIFCPSIGQSKRTLEYIRDIINNNTFLANYIDKRYNKGITATRILLKNGSRYECFGLRSKIDSADSSIIYVDELADCDESIINERILPTLASKKNNGLGNRLILSGVPKFVDDAIHKIVNGENKRVKVLPIIDYKKAIEFNSLDKDTVEMIKDTITEDEFTRAFECKWTADTFTFYPNKLLQSCYSKRPYSLSEIKEEPDFSFLGFDVSGRGGSNISQYALIIISSYNKKLKLSHYKIWDAKEKVELILDELELLFYKYKIKMGYFDDFGYQLLIRLQEMVFNKSEDKTLPLQSLKFSAPVKHNIFQNSKIMLEKGQVELPVPDEETNEFYRQMGNVKIEPTKASYFSYVKKNGRIPDDLPDAFTLACFACKDFLRENRGAGWSGAYMYNN